MLLQQTIPVSWHINNKVWYEEKGYVFSSFRSKFEVDIAHLHYGSVSRVLVECDYCKNIITKSYKALLKERENSLTSKDCCKDCRFKKQRESTLEKYGVECVLRLPEVRDKCLNTIKEKYGEEITNVFQVKEVKDKIKNKFIDNYGVENPMLLNDFKEKIKTTNREKYGVDFYTQTDEYKERVKITNLERYGVECVFQDENIKNKIKKSCLMKYEVEHPMKNRYLSNRRCNTNLIRYGFKSPALNKTIQEKIKKTNIARYGAEYTFSNARIREKSRATMLNRYGFEYAGEVPAFIEKRNRTLKENGNVPTSSQQISIYKQLLDHGFNVVLNEPISRSILDIALYIDDIKIDIEYDAAYFHKDQKQDRKRDEFLKSRGWKVLRIKSGHMLPDFKDLCECIESLVSSDYRYKELVLKDWVNFNAEEVV
jgi:very-short-patch-repair endonuclease